MGIKKSFLTAMIGLTALTNSSPMFANEKSIDTSKDKLGNVISNSDNKKINDMVPTLIANFKKAWKSGNLTEYSGIPEGDVKKALDNFAITIRKQTKDEMAHNTGGSFNSKSGEITLMSNDIYLQQNFDHEVIHKLGILDEGATVHLEDMMAMQLGLEVDNESTRYRQQENITKGIISVVGSKEYYTYIRNNDEKGLENAFNSKQNAIDYQTVKDYKDLSSQMDFYTQIPGCYYTKIIPV